MLNLHCTSLPCLPLSLHALVHIPDPSQQHVELQQSMNLLISFICLISAISCVITSGNKAAEKCTRQLEGIIHIPDNFYKTYMFGLLDELTELLGDVNTTDPAVIVPLFKEFAEKYDITIISQPSIGRRTTFTATTATPSPNRIFGQIVAPPYINFKGFNYDPENATYQASMVAAGANGITNTLIIQKEIAV
jgi:hypothetical protein